MCAWRVCIWHSPEASVHHTVEKSTLPDATSCDSCPSHTLVAAARSVFRSGWFTSQSRKDERIPTSHLSLSDSADASVGHTASAMSARTIGACDGKPSPTNQDKTRKKTFVPCHISVPLKLSLR